MHIDNFNLNSDNNFIEDVISNICDSDQVKSILVEALRYHFNAGGSRTRSKLTYKIARSFLIPHEDAVYLACIPELLHNASLIHDDLQDLDEERRQQQSLWKKYGSDIAICAGDYLISAAYACIAQINTQHTKPIISMTHEHVGAIIKGQISDLSQNINQSLDDITTYELISSKKSGALLSMCLTLPLIYSGRKSFVEYANSTLEHYAIAYQILDDVSDIQQDQSKSGVKPGVNIITILTKNNSPNPVLEAQNLAIFHLEESKLTCSKLPFPSNSIIENEIVLMKNRIQNSIAAQ
jgi:geranylgeranyl diphosphate synthase type II